MKSVADNIDKYLATAEMLMAEGMTEAADLLRRHCVAVGSFCHVRVIPQERSNALMISCPFKPGGGQ